MEASTSPVWQEAPSAQTVRLVHGMSVHDPRWHPVDGGPHSLVPSQVAKSVSMCSPLEKILVLRHAAACFKLHMWVPGGPIFRQNSFAVTWISVPGPKHTFLDFALQLETCRSAKCRSIIQNKF